MKTKQTALIAVFLELFRQNDITYPTDRNPAVGIEERWTEAGIKISFQHPVEVKDHYTKTDSMDLGGT